MKHVIDTSEGEENYTPERWAEVCKGARHATLFRIESQDEHGMVIVPVKYFQPKHVPSGEIETGAHDVGNAEDLGRLLREQASTP